MITEDFCPAPELWHTRKLHINDADSVTKLKDKDMSKTLMVKLGPETKWEDFKFQNITPNLH